MPRKHLTARPLLHLCIRQGGVRGISNHQLRPFIPSNPHPPILPQHIPLVMPSGEQLSFLFNDRFEKSSAFWPTLAVSLHAL